MTMRAPEPIGQIRGRDVIAILGMVALYLLIAGTLAELDLL